MTRTKTSVALILGSFLAAGTGVAAPSDAQRPAESPPGRHDATAQRDATTPVPDLRILLDGTCNTDGFNLTLRALNPSETPTDTPVQAEVFYRKVDPNLFAWKPPLVPHDQNPETVPAGLKSGGTVWHLNGFKPGSGEYEILARIDGADQQQESNENNNTATKSVVCP